MDVQEAIRISIESQVHIELVKFGEIEFKGSIQQAANWLQKKVHGNVVYIRSNVSNVLCGRQKTAYGYNVRRVA